jgi:hypothetical protein
MEKAAASEIVSMMDEKTKLAFDKECFFMSSAVRYILQQNHFQQKYGRVRLMEVITHIEKILN